MTSNPRIRRRLTAWYAGSVLVLLLVSVLSMRALARRSLAVQHEDSVQRAIELVRSFFRAELSEYSRVDVTLAHISGELVFAGMGIEFLRPDSVFFNKARIPNRDAEPRPPIRQILVPLERRLAPGWMLRLHVSMADLTYARQRIDRATLVALPIAVALAALTGWLVTGRALRPVVLMADAAERIGARSMGARLPISDPGDELGRLGRRFNDLLDRLDGALAQQRRFLADAAHELRTPMARMMAEAESRLSGPASREDRESLTRILSDLRSASSLVDELMQLARADAGSVDAVMEVGYLDDVVSDALAPWEAEARRRGIALRLAELEEAPAHFDPKLVSRLLGVFVHNALQYTPLGGSVDVRVRLREGRAALEVDDSGIGIPAHERDRIFERFFRGEAARQRAPEGSGLGLAIAGWIAQQHRAKLEVEAGTFGGTLMRVTFPPAAVVPDVAAVPSGATA